jgi:hypothetical protein
MGSLCVISIRPVQHVIKKDSKNGEEENEYFTKYTDSKSGKDKKPI